MDGQDNRLQSNDPEAWQQLAEAMTPSIVKVVEFAKGVPGFIQVSLPLFANFLLVMCLLRWCTISVVSVRRQIVLVAFRLIVVEVSYKGTHKL